MTDWEKVIKVLECLANENAGCYTDCPYYESRISASCFRNMAADALALLREQEPRVLTLEEVKSLQYGHALIETNKKEPIRWLDALLFCKNIDFSFDFITLEGRARLLGVEYNKEWRCWSARPIDDQRKAAPWSC